MSYYVHIHNLQGKGFSNVWAVLDEVGQRNSAAAIVMDDPHTKPFVSTLGFPVARIDEPDTLFPDWLLLTKEEIEGLFGGCFLVIDTEELPDIYAQTGEHLAAGGVFKTCEEAQDYCWDLYLDSLVKSNEDEIDHLFDLVVSGTGVASSTKGFLTWLKIVQL